MKRSKAIGISLLWLLLFFGIQIIISVAVAFGGMAAGGIGDIVSVTESNLPRVLLLSNIITVASVLLIVKLHGDKWSGELGLRRPPVTGIFLPILLAAALAPLISYLLDMISLPESVTDFYDQLMELAVVGDDPLSFVSTVILAPVCEELIFRGAIYNTLNKAFPSAASVILSALLFGFAHLNPIQSTYAFIVGLILCLVYIRFNSLWSSVLLHITFNYVGGYVDFSQFSDRVRLGILIGGGILAAGIAIWMAATYAPKSKKRKNS